MNDFPKCIGQMGKKIDRNVGESLYVAAARFIFSPRSKESFLLARSAVKQIKIIGSEFSLGNPLHLPQRKYEVDRREHCYYD